MGKLRRGVLWATFWPAGAVASVRAGQRKDADRIVGAIEGQRPRPMEDVPLSPGNQKLWDDYNRRVMEEKRARKRRK